LNRDSAVGPDGAVYCILKWETEADQKTFRANFDKEMAEKPEIMEEFGRLCNMETMTMDVLKVI
jgi:hypothetical protein